MKVTIKKTEEMEIKLPYFFKLKNINAHYAIINEGCAISVYPDAVNTFTYPDAIAQHIGSEIEITAGEFTTALDNELEKFQSLKTQFLNSK